MYLKFECPECKCDHFDEVWVDAEAIHTFHGMDDYGFIWNLSLGTTRVISGRLDRYGCHNCGWIIPLEEGVTDEAIELWLKEQEYNK